MPAECQVRTDDDPAFRNKARSPNGLIALTGWGLRRSIEPLGDTDDHREHCRHALLLDGEALFHRADAVLHRAKPILERGETMFERCHAALQAIKAMPKVAHFGGQRQNTRPEELQTDFLFTHPSPPPGGTIRRVQLLYYLPGKNATSTIPIVTTFGGDPVTTGLVVSFARPRTNVTGVSMMFAELTSKRLEQLTDLVPQARVIALLVNPNNLATEAIIRDAQVAAQTRGVELPILKATSESEIDAAFAALDQLRVGALIVGNDTFFFSRREQLVVLAARRALPASYFLREFSAAGGLISYGPNVMVVYRQVGIYAGKILNGARPADLPVVQPTTFELVVNLKTAKALRLTVPPSILAGADEVVE